jgi:hypothetical protein
MCSYHKLKLPFTSIEIYNKPEQNGAAYESDVNIYSLETGNSVIRLGLVTVICGILCRTITAVPVGWLYYRMMIIRDTAVCSFIRVLCTLISVDEFYAQDIMVILCT